MVAIHCQDVLLAHDSAVESRTIGSGSVLPQSSLNLRGCLLRLLNPFVAMLCTVMKRVRDQPHLGLGTKGFSEPVLIEDIFYLGDARSADDLAVFTGMTERLCLGCGLRVVELFSPHCDR